VDLETGEVTPFVPTGLTSPDGERQYYRKSVGTEGFAIVERDVATAKEREIIRHKNSNSTFSRDGQFAAMTYNDDPKASWPNAVSLVPLDGGRPRDLLRGSELLDRGVNWMPDSRAFLVTKRLNDSNDQSELWLVPIDGNPPRKIDIGTTHFAGFSFKLHPDGRQIAYVSGERNQEVWVLENFLPAVKPSK
jgi:Tol biopolymer transport system component